MSWPQHLLHHPQGTSCKQQKQDKYGQCLIHSSLMRSNGTGDVLPTAPATPPARNILQAAAQAGMSQSCMTISKRAQLSGTVAALAAAPSAPSASRRQQHHWRQTRTTLAGMTTQDIGSLF
jgi:hypothetical protein